MDTVLFVSPTLYCCGDSKNWQSQVPKPGYVPILKSDVPKFEQSLKQANSHRDHDKGNSVASKANETDNSDEFKTSTSRYVDLKSFLPISLEQQLHTVCLAHFPLGLGSKGIDKVMDRLDNLIRKKLQVEDIETNFIRQWSYVDCVNTLTVYISFQESIVEEYGKAIQLLEKLFDNGPDGIELHMDENTRRFVCDLTEASPAEELDETAKDEFSALITMLRSEPGSTSQEKGLAGNSAVEYNVDISALSDLPSSSLDQLCKDIVEFRTRVITLEKEKRNKELAEEEKRRKQNLKHIFDRIKVTNGGPEKGSAPEAESDPEDSDDEVEGYDDADDYEAEKKRVQAERDAQEAQYESMVHSFQDSLLVQYSSLRQEYQRLQNYETHLQKNKGSMLKELLHLAIDPYHDHHRPYKESESKADEEDRKRESEEVPKTKATETDTELEPEPETKLVSNADAITAAPKIKLALKKSIGKTKNEIEEEDIQEEETPETDAFQQKLNLLKGSGVVEELVKEYLGVYEPDLVSYIFENIEEHQSKQALETELTETFDEDSPVLVSRIWEAMEQ
ncbi:Snu71 [Kluyveromyces lactis]|nr:Snu71 [Kluyveromyces lactis]